MKITLESTTQITEITDIATGVAVPARLWEGETDSGVRVQALITRIVPDPKADSSQFDRELKLQRSPSTDFAPFPLRLIL